LLLIIYNKKMTDKIQCYRITPEIGKYYYHVEATERIFHKDYQKKLKKELTSREVMNNFKQFHNNFYYRSYHTEDS
jgi:hypothetical protein